MVFHCRLRGSLTFIVPTGLSKLGKGELKVTAKHSNTDGTYYVDADIARLFGISLGRLRNKLSAGSPLPPRIQPPGCRNRLWPREAVHTWLSQFMVGGAADDQDRRVSGRQRLTRSSREQ